MVEPLPHLDLVVTLVVLATFPIVIPFIFIGEAIEYEDTLFEPAAGNCRISISRSLGRIKRCSLNRTARRTRLINSRTLPGQG